MLRIVALLACSLLFTSACSTTKLVDHWQSPEFKASTMQDVLVVAVASNTTNRFLFETSFVEALTQRGISCTASYTAIGDALPTKESVEAYLKKSHHDHIVVVGLGGVDIETDYVPESVRTYYTGPYYGTWGSYWGGYWGGNTVTMTREAYVDTQTNVILTTSIYNKQNEELQWTGRSKTFEATSVSHIANELAKQMLRNLK